MFDRQYNNPFLVLYWVTGASTTYVGAPLNTGQLGHLHTFHVGLSHDTTTQNHANPQCDLRCPLVLANFFHIGSFTYPLLVCMCKNAL